MVRLGRVQCDVRRYPGPVEDIPFCRISTAPGIAHTFLLLAEGKVSRRESC